MWNPPPFLPVEGYTSFLWVVLLDGVWRLTGIEPPVSANWLSLACAYGSLAVAVLMVRQFKRNLGRWDSRLLFVAAIVVFLVLNRSFLAWSSSGLETSLMTFLLLLWVYVALSDRPPVWRAGFSAMTATALALTRPDGLLYCAATLVLVLTLALSVERRERALTLVSGLAPFAAVAAHLIWRLGYYGQWLPNTYYAKVVEAWPESGLRYLLCFVLEYGLWFAAVIIGWSLIGALLEVDENRHMAHSRRPPDGYVAGFRPNVAIRGRQILVEERTPPLSREAIVEHKRLWREGLEPDADRSD